MSLVERDKQVIWHPFTQHGIEPEFLPVVSGKGAWLTLQNGQQILDAISSWYVNLHGHAHPEIAQAIFEQAKILEHTIFAGFTHEPAVELAELLIKAVQSAGSDLTRCFYSDNGSTAVEAAMKMAYQYHKNRGVKTRTRFLSLSQAYHGDTLGAMAVSARNHFHKHFEELFHNIDFVAPLELSALEKCLDDRPDQYAALIMEPLVQAVVGMHIHTPEFLSQVAELCKQRGVLFICDEVFTGFYRTGTCFAFEQANIKPDLLCLGKGFTGGFLSLSAVLTTEEIFDAYRSKDVNAAFLHGHSYTANPLACAAAIASWKILHQDSTQKNIRRIVQQTQAWIARLSAHKKATRARSLGTIGALDMLDCPDYFSGVSKKIRDFSLQHNVLLRPLGASLYAVPPYCATEGEIDRIYGTMELILNELETFYEASA